MDMRDISIVDAFPVHDVEKVVMTAGSGAGRLEWHVARMGYRVYATDIRAVSAFDETPSLSFDLADVFDVSSFPVGSAPVVVCSEVLEHLTEWRDALANLLEMAEVRLILTVPYRHSYHVKGPSPVGHVNYWGDGESGFLDINEMRDLCRPFLVSISKIRTKPGDVRKRQWDYLVVVDKRQSHG